MTMAHARFTVGAGAAGWLPNLLAFQAAWFATVLGAANGLPWLGPVCTLWVLALGWALAFPLLLAVSRQGEAGRAA
jgi:Zn-dependent protease with chaperone function